MERSHTQSLLEVTARHHHELDLETERLRDSQLQAEEALEARERAHRQRVKCLEEQVTLVPNQIQSTPTVLNIQEVLGLWRPRPTAF